MNVVIVVLAMLFAAGLFVLYAAFRNIYVCSPNEVMIFSGRKFKADPNTGRDFIGFRVVRGGRAIRIPIIETVSRMSLTNIPIDLAVKGAFSRGGVPLNVVAVANIKFPSQEPALHNALERFLGMSQDQIVYVAKDTLEGCLRGVIAELSPEEINQQKKLFEKKLVDEAHKDMQRLGLVLDNLQIQNISDDVGYLSSVGRVRGAEVRKEARIGEVRAQAQALVQKADNKMRSEMAQIDAHTRVLQEENRRRIIEAETGREAMIAEVRGEVAAQIAEARAQVKRLDAFAEQTKFRLEADVVAPAMAKKLELEARAKAEAAGILAQGNANAHALEKLAESYVKAGPGARDAMLVQKLAPVFAQLTGTMRDIKVERLTVLGASDGMGPSLITLNEQIKAATGLDLAKRLSAKTDA
jgi:flotillin